jgi:hypothetical protein
LKFQEFYQPGQALLAGALLLDPETSRFGVPLRGPFAIATRSNAP